MHYRHRFTHSLLFIFVFCLLAVSLMPVAAATKAYLTVTSIWRPGVTLDSDGTDVRYVDAEIFVEGNVQFWAADFSCTVPDGTITQYAQDTSTATAAEGDDDPMVTWGPAWGIDGSEYVSMPAASGYLTTTANGYDAGTINFSATRLGTAAPIGQNGVTYTLLVATLRFEVQELTSNASAALTCKVTQFLDRNGSVVVKAKSNKMTALSVLDNYTISGSALYQGAKSPLGIGVECDDAGANAPISTVTDTKGAFKIATRVLDDYTCTFYGNALDVTNVDRQDDIFMGGVTNLTLDSHSHQLLPVLLRGGNTVTNGGSTGDEDVDVDDVTQITLNWDQAVSVYTNGDANGDGKANEVDLAIVGGSYGLSEELDYSHVIFGLAQDYNDKIYPVPNNRAWYGESQAGAVSSLVTSKTYPDFWPTLSPDGTYVALSRLNTKTGYYELYKVDLSKVPGTKATLLTPKKNYTLDAFASSWSPDGQRIAFICSQADVDSGWEYNQGDVCVVDISGNNLHQIASDAKIYPPAWYDDDIVLFAGTSANDICPNDLCYYDFNTDETSLVETSVIGEGSATGNEVADMPSVQYDDTTAYLFYRFNNTSSVFLKYAPLGSDLSAGTAGSHPVTTLNLDYYDVSPELDIIFYESGSDLFQNLIYDGGGSWSVGDTHYVDGFVGNPSWTGASNSPSYLHALRATMDWVP